jgi:hypothetical protein
MDVAVKCLAGLRLSSSVDALIGEKGFKPLVGVLSIPWMGEPDGSPT